MLIWIAIGVAALAVAGLVVRYRPVRMRREEAPRFPVATFLVGAFVLTSSWIGMRGPGHFPIADFPLLAAMPLLAVAVLRRRDVFPVPPWLLVVAGGLVVAALLPAMFVLEPPGKVLSVQSARSLGAPTSEESAFSLLLRMEYALVMVPVVVGAVAATWGRARVFADLWLASATISAAVGCIDNLTHVGIAQSLGVGPEQGTSVGARAIGLTFHPNYLGLFSAMALPIAITRIAQTKGVWRLAMAGASVVLLVSIHLSGSRLALLGAALGAIVLLILVPKFRTRMIAAGAAVAAMGVVLLVAAPGEESALERLFGDTKASKATDDRFRVIGDSTDIWLAHPLTGVGFDRIFDSHSIAAQFLESGGLVALATIVFWAFGFSRLGVQLSRGRRAPPHAAELAAALVAGLLAFLIPGTISPQVAERFLYVPAGVLVGLWAATARTPAAPEPVEARADAREGEPVGAAIGA